MKHLRHLFFLLACLLGAWPTFSQITDCFKGNDADLLCSLKQFVPGLERFSYEQINKSCNLTDPNKIVKGDSATHLLNYSLVKISNGLFLFHHSIYLAQSNKFITMPIGPVSLAPQISLSNNSCAKVEGDARRTCLINEFKKHATLTNKASEEILIPNKTELVALEFDGEKKCFWSHDGKKAREFLGKFEQTPCQVALNDKLIDLVIVAPPPESVSITKPNPCKTETNPQKAIWCQVLPEVKSILINHYPNYSFSNPFAMNCF